MSIMIIVPHEDDEILMTAGVIQHAVEKGEELTVVMATNGDYEGTDKVTGAVRLPETLEGVKVLGLSEEQVVFMGYADTGMNKELSFLYGLFHEEDEERIHPGHCSDETYGLPEKPDFHTKHFGTPAAYNRKNFKQDLKEIIAEKKPELLITTSPEDIHGDHSGLYFFVREVLRELNRTENYSPKCYTALVHSKAGDENWPLRETESGKYTCPEGQHEALDWDNRICMEVPENMKSGDLTKNQKAIALSKHKNALKEDAVEFLYSFMKAEEVFWNMELEGEV